uniref:C2H2-type domain-containing protein n=1 Tax=viral metagenome TaxID=1070528 RepID=A0A6C0CZP0_9ZZZZ
MNNKCEHCDTIFNNTSSLNNHKKKAKYCLIKQGKIQSKSEEDIVYNCEYCDKILSNKYNLNAHINTCSVKIEKEKLKEEEYVKQTIQTLSRENDKLKTNEKCLKENLCCKNNQIQELKNNYELQLEYKNNQIQELKTQIEKLQDTIASIAAQPKTVNQNNTTKTNNNNSRVNVINNLAPMTDDEYKKLGDMLQRSHLERGADGFAELAIQFFQGKAVCTDLSRRMVTHKDAEGRVVSDPNMTRLTTKFFGGLMDKNRELTLEILTDLQKRLEDKEIDFDEFMNILVRFSDQKFNVRKLADGDDKNEPTDEKGEYLQFKNTYVNKVCDKIYVKNN